MKNIKFLFLKIFRKIYSIFYPNKIFSGRNWTMFSNKEYANDLIYKALIADKPVMIARFGSTEMLSLVNYKGVKANNSSMIDFIKAKSLQWWWDQKTIDQMQQWSGFFPGEPKLLGRFAELMINDIQYLDILGSWLNQEKYFQEELLGVKKVVLEDLEPFFATNPWTRALAGKKVLVVHPFAETISEQYKKRELLFDNNLLPQFELKVIKAVQTIAGEKTEFKDWFEALEHMKHQIDSTNYDICIIGCGAYGFPLAAHVKRQGKKSIHLAGVTQLLFGIKGKRWEEFVVWPYENLFNKYWVRPGAAEKPKNAIIVEGGTYW